MKMRIFLLIVLMFFAGCMSTCPGPKADKKDDKACGCHGCDHHEEAGSCS
jgi:hypothetical protein